jgi:hypothetical protein
MPHILGISHLKALGYTKSTLFGEVLSNSKKETLE